MKKPNNISIGILEINEETPIELREKLNFHTSELDFILDELKSEKLLLENIFLCTCNRTILIFIADSSRWDSATSTALNLFKRWSGDDGIVEYIKIYRDKQALKKLLFLSVGANSAMLGEDQILGQIRFFYKIALENNLTGPVLNKIIQTLIFVARKIKLENPISKGRVSISGLIVKKIKEYETKNEIKNILMIGWGEISFTVYKILSADSSNYDIAVSNRTLEKVNVDTRKIDIGLIKDESKYFDVIISKTSRMGYVLNTKTNLLDNKKYLFFDLGVPRNIDPGLRKKDNVCLVDIDDLNKIAKKNLEKRRQTLDFLDEDKNVLLFQEKMMIFLNDYSKLSIRNHRIHKALLEELRQMEIDLNKVNIREKNKICNFINKKIYRDLN
ncbi:MAG: hypothetical protein WC087_02705 [Candidatus Paceibacterota bacterium]